MSPFVGHLSNAYTIHLFSDTLVRIPKFFSSPTSEIFDKLETFKKSDVVLFFCQREGSDKVDECWDGKVIILSPTRCKPRCLQLRTSRMAFCDPYCGSARETPARVSLLKLWTRSRERMWLDWSLGYSYRWHCHLSSNLSRIYRYFG